MSRKTLCLDEFTESLAGMAQCSEQQNDMRHKAMLRVLKKAVEGELTQRQRDCVILYYYQQKRMSQIAQELGIDISTVSKHLNHARKRLSKVMGYYFIKLQDKKE